MKKKTIITIVGTISAGIIGLVSYHNYNKYNRPPMNGAVAMYASFDTISPFNNQFEMYAGKQVGINVKSLIQALSESADENKGEAERLPDLYYQAKSANEQYSEVKSTVADPNIKGFIDARAAIQARHYYHVVLGRSSKTGLINCIYVLYEGTDESIADALDKVANVKDE